MDNGEHFFTKDLCLFQICQRSWKLQMVGTVLNEIEKGKQERRYEENSETVLCPSNNSTAS